MLIEFWKAKKDMQQSPSRKSAIERWDKAAKASSLMKPTWYATKLPNHFQSVRSSYFDDRPSKPQRDAPSSYEAHLHPCATHTESANEKCDQHVSTARSLACHHTSKSGRSEKWRWSVYYIKMLSCMMDLSVWNNLRWNTRIIDQNLLYERWPENVDKNNTAST